MVYQIYPRSFADSNGDGIGDLPGITARLDHLSELGVDALWLSPIYRSPQDDNGYDIADYQDVDPMFGTLTDLDALIAAAHVRGIKIVMDLVVNHTSDEHPWFVESRSSTDNPKRDWYIWRKTPNNWESIFSGSAWELDDDHRRVLPAPLLPQAARPQLGEPGGPAGRLRDDAVVGRARRRRLPHGRHQPDLEAAGPARRRPVGRCCANGPRVHEFVAEMHREVLAGRELLAVGETPGAGIDDARRYSDPARAEIDMVFTFEHVSLDAGTSKWDLRPLRLTDLKANLSAWQDGLAAAGWNSLYWDNHDQPRIVSRWGDDGEHRVASAKTLATVLHLLRGTPYVYQGEELGMTNAHFTRLDSYHDIESVNWAKGAIAAGLTMPEVLHALAVKSRDNARTPVQWDATEHAGFTTGTPWLPVNANHTEINAEAARKDPDSVFHHYRRLIELRHLLPVVVHGDYRLLLPDDEQVFAYVRTLDGTTLTVLANLSGAPAAVPGVVGDVLLSTHDRAAPPSELAAWESLAVLSTG